MGMSKLVCTTVGCCVLISGLLLSGCVTVPGETKLAQTTLMTARAGNTAKLSWETKPGVYYTIFYAVSRKATSAWKPLPQATKLRGTGSTIEITDHIPGNQNRVYRIHAEVHPTR